MLASLLLPLLLWTGRGAACPFYQLIVTPMGAPTTNYTTLSAAMVAAMAGPEFAAPIVVCDGASVGADETLPIITAGLMIVGESGGGGTPFTDLTIDNPALGHVFVVDAPNGVAVTVESLAIVAGEQTLFAVFGSATLTLHDVKCELTATCVLVSTNGAPAAVPPGLDADTVFFVGTHAAVVHVQGTVACRHCTFLDTFEVALVTRLAVYDPYVFFALYDVHFENTLYPLAYQSAPGAPLSPPELSPAFVDRTLFTNCQTYSLAATTVELFGTAGCPICSSCDCPPCYNKWINISLVILLALSIAICVVTCVFRASASNKPPTAAQMHAAQNTGW